MADNDSGGGSFTLGLLVGGIIGGLIGLLLAPKAGSETRTQIWEQSETLRTRADEAAASLRERFGPAIDTLRERGTAAADTVREAGATAIDVARTRASAARGNVGVGAERDGGETTITGPDGGSSTESPEKEGPQA